MSEKLKPCPFCGGEVVMVNAGVSIEVGCCASMSLQKSDVLTIAERTTWGQKPFRYSDEAEGKALQHVTSMWNNRPGEDKLQERVDALEWLRDALETRVAKSTGDIDYTRAGRIELDAILAAAHAAVEKNNGSKA